MGLNDPIPGSSPVLGTSFTGSSGAIPSGGSPPAIAGPKLTGLRKAAQLSNKPPKCTQGCDDNKPNELAGKIVGYTAGTFCAAGAGLATAPAEAEPGGGTALNAGATFLAGQACYDVGYDMGANGTNPFAGVDW